MKFTRLRLSGFKTFLDASEVVIEPGLTGIVGPNGCGKSNLVESLRWVMGESSYKALRGSGMDDVIFAGGGSRPARNSAEVALTIDNSERRAPAQFNDSDTLEVVRRIEREAGSVYRVNGRDVRARDVQLLFADASTGAHSTALVRQGQIAELIAAKPQARRRILEEAAGIAGLHGRRHEAELRLRAAEQNLERLEDVVGQLAGQIEALARQARQAARYRQLSAGIRRHEAIMWSLRRRQALADLEDKLARVREAHRAVAARTEAAGAAATRRAEAAAGLPALRHAEAERAAALRRLATARDGLESERTRLLARGCELSQRLQQIEQDLAREARTAAETHDTIAALDAEDATLTAESAAAEAARPALREAMAGAQRSLQAVEARFAEATRAAAELAARRRQLEAATRDHAQRTARLATQAAGLEEERGRLRASLASAEIDTLAARARETAAAHEAAEAALASCEAAIAAARRAEAEAREPVQAAERELGALTTERDTLARLLSADGGAAAPALLDAVTVEKGYEAALGAAFGEDLDHSSDPAAPIHWRALDADDMPPLPAGAVPLAEHVRAPAVLARRLAATGLVDQAAGAELQPRLRPGQCLVSRAGDIWRWDGFTAAADAPTAAARRLEQANRVRELETAIAGAETNCAALRATRTEAQQELARQEQAGQAAREELRRTREAARGAGAAHDEAVRRVGQVAARVEALDEQAIRVAEEQRAAEAARAAAQEEFAALPPDTGEESRLAAVRAEVATARAELAEARAAVDAEARETQARAARVEALERERQRWRDRVEQSGQHIETLRRRDGELRAEIEEIAARPAELERRRDALAGEIEAAEAARRAAADAVAKAEGGMGDADRAAREADGALAAAREGLAREEATVEGLRTRLADLDAASREALGRPLGEALRAAGIAEGEALPALSEVEAALEKARRDRDRLGSVNLRAEEEMREVSERHDGLVAEREDLLAAIGKLRTAIQGLNREGRERLLRSFDVVNGHFKALFTRLFGGGEAELTLTESDDPLEAGLEIVARPPGKRPQVLTLLSGGEQALTATALIFAVFLTNPAPICVLDEVDAPLDDANVERFCALMEEMARQTDTRFLLITHNPITMARMNRLFGVTMAERGVSQLVSVDIEAAQAMREAS